VSLIAARALTLAVALCSVAAAQAPIGVPRLPIRTAPLPPLPTSLPSALAPAPTAAEAPTVDAPPPPLPTAPPLAVSPEEAVPIENAAALRTFFAALGELEAGAVRRVRVTQLGDSHIAADMWSGRARALLQARFGNGGRGFVSAGRPWPSYSQGQVRGTQTGIWRADGLRGGLDDGRAGPSTCSVATADSSATATLDTTSTKGIGAPFSALNVLYLRQPGGACMRVEVDGDALAVVDTRGPWSLPAATRFDLRDAPHRVVARSLSPAASGELRLIGFSLERTSGLVWDALGINGAQARRLLREAPEALSTTLDALAPDLIVVSYGTNELFDRNLNADEYARALDEVLTRLRGASPNAACLLTGPFDALQGRRPPKQFDAVYAVQRALAERQGCAFWDARRAMGGAGAIRAWRRKGWAQRDNVHLTRSGYEALGDHLVAALLAARTRLTESR